MLENGPERSGGVCPHFIICWSFSKRRSEQERVLSDGGSSHHENRGSPGLWKMSVVGLYLGNGSYNPHCSYARHSWWNVILVSWWSAIRKRSRIPIELRGKPAMAN